MLLNTKRARSYMLKHGLTALVAASPVNVSYFTGLDCWMYRNFREYMWVPGGTEGLKQAFAILPLEGKPALVLDFFTLPFAEGAEVETVPYGRQTAEPKTGNDASGKDPDDAAGVLAKAMADMGLARGTVGTELGYLAPRTRSLLSRNLPGLRLADARHLLRLIRMSKTADEVQRMEMAAETNERGLKRALESARPGTGMGRLRRAYVSEVADRDSQLEHFIYSPRGTGITDFDGYRLKDGDVTYVDTGCTYKMYNSDTGTTLVVGKPRAETVRTQKKLWEATERMFDWLRPGFSAGEAFDNLEGTIEDSGVKSCHYEGHGIGLEVREHPILSILSKGHHRRIADSFVKESVDLPLEEGMAINIEVPVTDYGNASLQVERTFLIGHRKTTEIGGSSKATPHVAGG